MAIYLISQAKICLPALSLKRKLSVSYPTTWRYSRKVLSWRISNSMVASFCVDCLEEVLRNFSKPEIFNSDQGSQFTRAYPQGQTYRPDALRLSNSRMKMDSGIPDTKTKNRGNAVQLQMKTEPVQIN